MLTADMLFNWHFRYLGQERDRRRNIEKGITLLGDTKNKPNGLPRNSKEDRLASLVYKIVLENGEKGVLQSELWKKLNLTSRDGSRIATKLERRKLIKRERVLEDGRWTYLLKPMSVPISVKAIMRAPCINCPFFSRCYPDGQISPRTCAKLERWVLSEYEAFVRGEVENEA